MFLYKIVINNWDKYNQKKRRGHESIMVSCRFFDDPKIQRLTPHQKLIYLRCLLVAGDFSTGSIEVTSEFIARSTGVPRQMVDSSLNVFQELQLVTVEKIPLLKNRIEEKRREEKRKELNHHLKSVVVPPSISVVDSQPQEKPTSRVWEAYKSAYVSRHGVEPVRNAHVNSQISNLVKRLGAEDATSVVKFYLSHNDGFYLKNLHPIGLCLKDCESLRTQMVKGKAITSRDVSRFEKVAGQQEMLKDGEKGGF